MPDSLEKSGLLVDRTEISDVRALLLSVEVYEVEMPDEIDVSVDVSNPQYAIHDERLLVRVTHHVGFYAKLADADDMALNRAKLAEISVAHVVELTVQGKAPESAEIDDLFFQNTIFMIHPYARAAVQRLAADAGLPAVVLPYLRREV